MELYILRHGTTDWNKQKRFQGSQDINLNEEGRQLAIKVGKRFSSENISFDCIYSSPLKRAYETACLIKGENNYPVIKNPLLREISFGSLEGMPYDEWMNTEDHRKYFFTNPIEYIPPEGGETLNSVCERTKEFVQTIIEPIQKNKPDSRIMIVAHGALLAGMMCYLDNHGIETFWGSGLKGNCEETVYNFDGKKWTLKK